MFLNLLVKFWKHVTLFVENNTDPKCWRNIQELPQELDPEVSKSTNQFLTCKKCVLDLQKAISAFQATLLKQTHWLKVLAPKVCCMEMLIRSQTIIHQESSISASTSKKCEMFRECQTVPTELSAQNHKMTREVSKELSMNQALLNHNNEKLNENKF